MFSDVAPGAGLGLPVVSPMTACTNASSAPTVLSVVPCVPIAAVCRAAASRWRHPGNRFVRDGCSGQHRVPRQLLKVDLAVPEIHRSCAVTLSLSV